MSYQKVCLGDLATFANGYAFKPSDWTHEGLEIIRIQNLTNSSRERNFFKGKLPDKYKVTKGDILISWSATLDIFIWNGEDGWLNQHIFKVVFNKEKLDKTFFFYLIKFVLDDMKRHVHGSTMQHITKVRFDNLKVPLPSFSIQKKIAVILEKADSVRQKDKQLLEHYNQLAQSIFHEIFGYNGELESKYERLPLSSVSEVVSGVTLNSKNVNQDWKGYPYLRVFNVQDGFFDLSEVKQVKASKSEFDKYLLKKDDILLTEGGDPDKLGRGSIWKGEIENCIHQNHIFRVRINSSEFDPVFISSLFGSTYGKRYFLKAAKQTTGIASINSTQLKAFPLIKPPISLQNKFNRAIQNINAAKEYTKLNAEKSNDLFQSLLQRAFKGELVKEH